MEIEEGSQLGNQNESSKQSSSDSVSFFDRSTDDCDDSDDHCVCSFCCGHDLYFGGDDFEDDDSYDGDSDSEVHCCDHHCGDEDEPTSLPEKLTDTNGQKTYIRGEFLGKGAFGRCYKVEDSSSKKTYACKMVDTWQLDSSEHRQMKQEISIHRGLKHNFVVEFQSNFKSDRFICIILELCDKKSLEQLLARRKTITETETRYFMRQLSLAVSYLHDEKHIIHRDLKPDNIFIDENMNLKVGDFGLATVLRTGEMKRKKCGTYAFMAPEIVNGYGYSYEADLWSIGCILYALLVGRIPFRGGGGHMIRNIISANYSIPPNRLSPAAEKLVRRMLSVHPSMRPSAKEILQSDFMTKFYVPANLPHSCVTIAPRFDHRIPISPEDTIDVESGKDIINPDNYMASLRRKIRVVLLSNPLGKKVKSDDDAEDPKAAPLLWVSKWVDYTEKLYAFAYQLSDDSIGVSFNDNSQIVLLPDGIHFQYIKNSDEQFHTKSKYPSELQKKVIVLNHVQDYINIKLRKTDVSAISTETAQVTRLPTMWTWSISSNDIAMVLTNGTLQINLNNHQKIILCPFMGAITILQHQKPMRTYKLALLKQNGCTEVIYNALVYAREKLDELLNYK